MKAYLAGLAVEPESEALRAGLAEAKAAIRRAQDRYEEMWGKNAPAGSAAEGAEGAEGDAPASSKRKRRRSGTRPPGSRSRSRRTPRPLHLLRPTPSRRPLRPRRPSRRRAR